MMTCGMEIMMAALASEQLFEFLIFAAAAVAECFF